MTSAATSATRSASGLILVLLIILIVLTICSEGLTSGIIGACSAKIPVFASQPGSEVKKGLLFLHLRSGSEVFEVHR